MSPTNDGRTIDLFPTEDTVKEIRCETLEDFLNKVSSYHVKVIKMVKGLPNDPLLIRGSEPLYPMILLSAGIFTENKLSSCIMLEVTPSSSQEMAEFQELLDAEEASGMFTISLGAYYPTMYDPASIEAEVAETSRRIRQQYAMSARLQAPSESGLITPGNGLIRG